MNTIAETIQNSQLGFYLKQKGIEVTKEMALDVYQRCLNLEKIIELNRSKQEQKLSITLTRDLEQEVDGLQEYHPDIQMHWGEIPSTNLSIDQLIKIYTKEDNTDIILTSVLPVELQEEKDFYLIAIYRKYTNLFLPDYIEKVFYSDKEWEAKVFY